MTYVELLNHVALAVSQGLSFTVISVERERHPRSERMRLLPGSPSLFGRLVGSRAGSLGTRLIVSIAVEDVRRWLVGHLSWVERDAVRLMEAGDHGGADEMLAQFVALRDRLPNLPPLPVEPT